MARPVWPPRYVNVPVTLLRDEQVPPAAFRFYCKLRALAWGEPTLHMELKRLFVETGLGQSQVYEYARTLRDRSGLLFRCADGVFECSFPDLEQIPEIPELPTLSLSKSKGKNTERGARSGKAGIEKSPIPAAIQAFRSIANRYPDKAVWPKIAAVVGEKPDDLERWQRTITGWIAAGHYKLNVGGMLDWYGQGRTSKAGPVVAVKPATNGGRMPDGV